MKNCLIFGGNGFLGSNLAGSLLKEGYRITVFDSFKFGALNLNDIKNDINIIKGDFSNEGEVDRAMKGMDYVFHYISTTTPATSITNPVCDVESNISNSIKLFASAVKNNVEKVVFPSSGGTIYGEPKHVPCKETDPTEPLNPYAISKLAIEKYLHYFYDRHGLDYLILRYSNPYGRKQNLLSKQGVIPIFLNKIKNNERPVIYGDGNSIRDYIYVDDLVDATILALKKNNNYRLFNVGSGNGTSLNEVIDIMSDATGKDIKPQYVPDNIKYITKIILDIDRIETETGWKPKVDLKNGIRQTWEWVNGL